MVYRVWSLGPQLLCYKICGFLHRSERVIKVLTTDVTAPYFHWLQAKHNGNNVKKIHPCLRVR